MAESAGFSAVDAWWREMIPAFREFLDLYETELQEEAIRSLCDQDITINPINGNR